MNGAAVWAGVTAGRAAIVPATIWAQQAAFKAAAPILPDQLKIA